MNINEFLNKILDQNPSLLFNGNEEDSFVILTVNSWNCELEIRAIGKSYLELGFKYLNDTKNNEVEYEKQIKHLVHDFNEIKEALNRIFELREIQYNRGFPLRDFPKRSKEILDLFKIVLADKDLPPNYSLKIIDVERIQLHDNSTNEIFELNFKQLYSKESANRFKSQEKTLLGAMYIAVEKTSDNGNEWFNLVIPAYDLKNYPFLASFALGFQINNHIKSDDWFKAILDFPDVYSSGVQAIIQQSFLNKELPSNNENNKKKPKI